MSIRRAAIEARKSVHHQHRMGAVVVKGHRILSTGFNELRPSGLLRTNSLHAEASAILKLLKEKHLEDLAGSEIYVTRHTKGGYVGLARPCFTCMSLIRSVGIRHIHYSNDDGSTTTIRVE